MIGSDSFFIIDGNEQNAGEREFVRNTSVYIVDGFSVGSASERLFARNTGLYLIEGPLPAGSPLSNATMTGAYVIDGRPPVGVQSVKQMSTYLVTSKPKLGVFASRYGLYTIDME